MTLDIYLAFLEPPGAIAATWEVKEPHESLPDEDKIMSYFFGMALHLTALHLQTQAIESGHTVSGEKPAEYYIERWRKTARPRATVSLRDGMYLLLQPVFPGEHPIAAQAWRYFKGALDIVSDDLRDGHVFRDLVSYERALPMKLLTAHKARPPLTYGAEKGAA